MNLLDPDERERFACEFQEDLRFLKLALLLINKSCPIKNVELIWMDSGQRGELRTVGTSQALDAAESAIAAHRPANPNPLFCQIVNDYGRRHAESCGRSDRMAAEAARRTGASQVYRCHAGLIDIAVPVVAEGRYIATLYSGQVLTEAPTDRSFVEVTRLVERLDYLDRGALREAYAAVPVVTPEEIRDTVQILESFAAHIATSWTRLRRAVELERRNMREHEFQRKEFAHLALEGSVADRPRLRSLVPRLGFTGRPNRVMVVKLHAPQAGEPNTLAHELAFTRAYQAMEEAVEKLRNVSIAHLRDRGICVFLHESGKAGGVKASAVAGRILEAAGAAELRPQIGIGNARRDLGGLLESYEEAVAALATGELIAFYKADAAAVPELTAEVSALCRLFDEGLYESARLRLNGVPRLIARTVPDADLATSRRLFQSVLDTAALSVERRGADPAPVRALVSDAAARLARARGQAALEDAFRRAADSLLDENTRAHAGRHEKLVERARRAVLHRLEQPELGPVSLAAVARETGISGGHLSRIFKRVAGCTFERFVMLQRVEMAKRLLLEPLSNVYRVAETCGFSTPAYFARVFRKVVGCSPRQYCNDPMRHTGSERTTSGAAPETGEPRAPRRLSA